MSGRAVSVADSLFRPHPEQRARASREPKIGESCPAVCAFAPQSPQSPPSPEQTVEKLHGVGLCTTTGRFGGCGAEPLHRLGSRTRQIGRVRTRPDAKKGVAAGRVRPSVRFPPRRWRNLRRRDQLHKSTSPPGRVRTRPQLHKVHNRRGKLPRGVCLCTQNVHKVHKVHSRRWRNCTVCAFAPPPDDSEAVVRSLRTV